MSGATRTSSGRLTVRRSQPASSGEVRSSRRPLDHAERALVALEGVVSIGGLAGGYFMASHPLTTMPLKYLEGTWFHTWRWPGIALFFFVGVCTALSVAATLLRSRFALLGHFGVGIGLVAWIVLEATWMVVSLPLQLTFALVGVAIIVLAAEERRLRTRR